MTKQEFKAALISKITEQGRPASDEQIKSALDKMARHLRNRDGCVSWDEEDVDNAVCFFNEYKQQNTFNRETYRINK